MNAARLTTPKDKARELQRALYLAAKKQPKRRFHALYDKVYREDILREAWRRVRENRGAAGIDGQTIRAIEEEEGVEGFLQGIREDLQAGRYRPRPVRRVYIPKPDGRKRPLGIPTVRDRVVQMATKIAIEPIFEADFKDCSYGFRPKRSAHQAIKAIGKAASKSSWVVDADIVGFFDNINHEKLMLLVQQRVSDRRILKLIRQWLKAGVMDAGEFQESDLGSPQGGVISPLLANIYLNYLDGRWEKNGKHLGALVRYADDLVVLCRTKRDAEKAMDLLKHILGRLELEMHPQKTKLANLWDGREGFDFLGFHHRKAMKKSGISLLTCWPSKKAMKSMRAKVRKVTGPRARLKEPLEQIIQELNARIRGWAEYYGVGMVFRHFAALDWYVTLRLLLFMNKKTRSRRGVHSRVFTREFFEAHGLLRLYGRSQWQLSHAAR
ncbi:MAG: group II intron reverse transcriptase/maturase [Bacillota bacterium]